MTKSEIKNSLVNNLKKFLNEYGFEAKNIIDIEGREGAQKWINNILYYFGFSIDSDGSTAISYPVLRYETVEQIMFKVTGDSQSLGKRTLQVQSKEVMENYYNNQKTIKSESDVVQLADNFKKYFVELYLPAFEKYSDPKNVLELWDSLEGVKERNDFFPGPDKYIRVLIISKMCKEQAYFERCKNSLNIYKQKVADGNDYKQELQWCEDTIKYLAENEL